MSAESSLARAKAPHPRIAVLGIGAIEQHGPHLPVGTDWMVISALSQRVAEALGVWLLPAIPFSMSECHGPLAGTVWLKPASLAAALQDIAASLYAQKINQLLILNGHGGNFILEPAIKSIRARFPTMTIAMPPEPWPERDELGLIFEQAGTDLHAGEIETSLMLFLYPSLVQEECINYVPPVGREFLDYTTIEKICPQGVWGHASLGLAEKGERAMAAEVKAVVSFARKAFRRRK